MERPTAKALALRFGGLAAVTLCIVAPFFVVYHEPRNEAAAPAGRLTLPKHERPELDREDYDRRLRRLAHVSEDVQPDVNAPAQPRLWPVDAAYPNAGAILPFKRIVAYYGNFSAKSMGVLGEYPEEVMLKMLDKEAKAWEAADPTTPVQKAVDYIAIPAQAGAGADGLYRMRMSDAKIDHALEVAAKIDGIVILEVQAGLSGVMTEVRSLGPYLAKPQVHLAIDPEFAMKPSGARPGTRVGTVDAALVNEVADYLAGLVQKNDLPPKVLIVHRYTREMVTNARKIEPLPEVQILMDMDGWGPPEKKYSTYNSWIKTEPVQFTGFKLFYKNDIKRPGSRLLTPAEVLKLTPQPSFIQYQ
ncbi:MAG TPA: hypothetical protein VL500_05445 [Candidatus Eisenbacteria bacterium]|jgi:hypothetical protein|nr:hypothetical protein [Candidatus Eisenbacteria bacterium]